MLSKPISKWIEALGYNEVASSLHHLGDAIPADHTYAIDLQELLRKDGAIQAQAIFDVEGVPTVCFVDDSTTNGAPSIEELRQRIWNQNLISIILVVTDDTATAYPVDRKTKPDQPIQISEANPRSRFSAAEIASNDIQLRLPSWFRPEVRVDRHLLDNLSEAVRLLSAHDVTKDLAQELLGQVMFISFLEHRGIVSDTYRARWKVKSFHDLVHGRDVRGINKLIGTLNKTFNGDFLNVASEAGPAWEKIAPEAFGIVDDFLCRVDLKTGQQDFWNYDFRYIPVETLSGIYESFLGEEREELSAFYTPRHLAHLAIDQAFNESKDILDEVIYDGACGSGILLTTAFRRMLGVAEARHGAQLSLEERIAFLKEHIFGSDISSAACKVTAFSLYLSLLERLSPSDCEALRVQEGVKLPRLRDKNLFSGKAEGDFFSKSNPLAGKRKFTLILSNPPWGEPSGGIETTADIWAEENRRARNLRDIAGDFAQRSLDCVTTNGRVCLILTPKLFLSQSSHNFVRDWMLRARISRLINFGDLQGLLFKAEHSCVVVVASPRENEETRQISSEETFEYWTPKADISLALGRLTLHSGDRHLLQTQTVIETPDRLLELMWGQKVDIALWTKLRMHGVIGDLVRGNKRFVSRKGFHKHDKHREPVSSRPLSNFSYIPVDALKTGVPIVHSDDLTAFPSEIEKVYSKLDDGLLDVFTGPRIVFPDGFDRRGEIRVSFIKEAASFSSSIGVFSGSEADEALLQFMAIYLRSSLAKYFLLMVSYPVLCERNRVSLTDIKKFPFITPENHPSPDTAWQVLREIAEMMQSLAKAPSLTAENLYQDFRGRLEELVYDYFGLSKSEREVVEEAVRELLPSVRPRSYESLRTSLQLRADDKLIKNYVCRLRTELEDWRRNLQGEGDLDVRATVMPQTETGALGVVRVSVSSGKGNSRRSTNDLAINAVLGDLRKNHLLPMEIGTDFYFLADTIFWAKDCLYLVRPLARRYWLQRTAISDAQNIVRDLHGSNRNHSQSAQNIVSDLHSSNRNQSQKEGKW